jgi:hypothetical protein
LIGTIEHRSGNSRVQTFPGAACCITLGSAKILRAIMRWIRRHSKAAPLQALGESDIIGEGKFLISYGNL